MIKKYRLLKSLSVAAVAFVIASLCAHSALAGIGSTGPIDDMATNSKSLYYVVENASWTTSAVETRIPVYRTTPGVITTSVINITQGPNGGSANFSSDGLPVLSACQGKVSGTCAVDISTSYDVSTGLYKGVLLAKFTGSGTSDKDFIAFQISVPAGMYVGGGGGYQYATQMMPYDRNDGGKYTISMATPCSVKTATTKTLTFYDLDSGNATNERNAISVTVKNKTQGTNVTLRYKKTATDSWHTTSSSFSLGTQGNNAQTSIEMTFDPLNKYSITLDSIYGINTMVYSIPYDSVNYAVDCKDYNLTPITSVSGANVVVPGDTASYSEIVKNTGKTGRGDVTYHAWSFVVPRAQVGGFNFGSKGDVDNSDCAALYGAGSQCARIDNGGEPTTNITVANGNTQNLKWPNGSTTFSRDTSGMTLQAGDIVCSYVAIARPYITSNYLSAQGKDPDPNNQPQWRVSAPACVRVGRLPSIQIWGNDLRVGSPFASGVATSSTVTGTIRTRGTSTYGSWSEYSVIAPAAVGGAASGSGILQAGATVANWQGWSKLTFANTPGMGNFAGASTLGQIPDVKSYLQRYGTKLGLTMDDQVNPRTVNITTYEGNKVYIVNGTVNIKSDIVNSDSSVASEKQLKQMIIIANTINIDPSVTRVDAWLIAPGGTVNTCTNAPVQLTITDCATTLTVNGPVMAKTFNARRTAGENEVPAEIVDLRSDAYLWARSVTSKNSNFHTVYSTELPPRY